MVALGMIEVSGYLGAVAVADTALKTADVRLSNTEVIHGGLTTIELVGDVAAVNAAVIASVEIANQLNCLISSHVIPRLDEQTKYITRQYQSRSTQEVPLVAIEENPSENHPEKENASIQQNAVQESEGIQKSVAFDFEKVKKELEAMKVVELRKKAYKMNLKALTKNEIKFAKKAELLTAILAGMEGSDIEWN